jgi:hypothetical protein
MSRQGLDNAKKLQRENDGLTDARCEFCANWLSVEDVENEDTHCDPCRWKLGEVFDPGE